MHFAQTLDAGVIPEWKSQYINYHQGKKLIAKLERSLGEAPSWRLPPPAQTLDQPSYHTGSRPDGPRVEGSRGEVSREGGLRKVANDASSTLPPETARLRDRQSPLDSRGYALTPLRKGRARVVNERSPLLDTPGQRLYTTPQDVPESASGSIPMQPIDSGPEAMKAAQKQFFKWLNGEVSRANNFYAGMEHESATKLSLLESQLEHFRAHKAMHQRERARGVPAQASTFMETLDFPTLPAVFKGMTRSNHKVTRSAAHTSDFTNRDDHVSYYQAKVLLRAALSEYYQSLVQLKAFRQLNETATRKIVKKFDKQLGLHTLDRYLDETHRLPIRSSGSLQNMISLCEQLYADNFTRGNHKAAVDALNLGSLGRETSYDISVLLSGLLLGAALPLLIIGIYNARHADLLPPAETRFTLQMWGGFVLVGLMLLGFAAALAVWTKFKVNYAFILELDRATMLDFRQYTVLPALYLFGVALLGWLTYTTVQSMHRYYPALFVGLFGLALGFPAGPYWEARRWLLHALWRLVFSGLYSVEFRDLMMGDVMCSLTYPLSTMSLFFCVYGTPHWWSGPGSDNALRCTSRYSRSMGFLNCLPGIWRFLQCWRRYADTLDWFPHLLNAGKYSFTILYYMSLSLARISPENGGLKAMFITFALINGLYTAIWDVLMDFSLSPSAGLRSVLVYPRWTYWIVMIIDPVMRQNWVLYAVFWKYKEQGALVSFIVALIEALRRIIWIIFRVENEQAANIARCRAFKDLNLPYDDISEAAKPSQRPNEQDQSGRSRVPTRATTFPIPGSATASAEASPSASRFAAAFSPLSPKLQFAHTSDFQRRDPKAIDDAAQTSEDDDEELAEDDLA